MRKRLILYQPICRQCHFVVKSSKDVFQVKRNMQDHLEKSHGSHFTLINGVSLKDFSELFKIMRWTKYADFKAVGLAERQPEFYAVACRPKIQSVSA